MQDWVFTISVEDFDLSLLPEGCRTLGTDAFAKAVSDYMHARVQDLGGTAEVLVDPETITVSWRPEGEPSDPLQRIIGKLEKGEYSESILLLKLLLSRQPENAEILYKLGMALGDTGHPEEAEKYLRRALSLQPKEANVAVALGVALSHQGRIQEAIEIFESALRLEFGNPWAHENLGVCLLSLGRAAEAEGHFRKAIESLLNDQACWFGLASALGEQGKTTDADDAYKKTIALNPHTDIAELARTARSKIAHATFRKAVGPGAERPDAVMYCLAALQKFEPMTPAKVQSIAFEIAALGTRGLDVNNPAKKYRLRSLPGDFTGLQLVCTMYVGFKRIAPEQDIGFNLSKEYAAALDLHGKES